MEINKAVASTVRAEMARHGVNQRMLANALHTSQAAVSRRLTGEVDWSARELVIVADVIGCKATLFLDGVEFAA